MFCKVGEGHTGLSEKLLRWYGLHGVCVSVPACGVVFSEFCGLTDEVRCLRSERSGSFQ